MKVHVFRLKPHQDLKGEIHAFAKNKNILAGVVVSCVGSLEQYNLRFANREVPTQGKGRFEIVSLSGTLSASFMHLHLAISDENGKTIGGHLMSENYIYTTAEIAILELSDVEFLRETDSTYGYHELVIKKLTS
jgi:predicted DNA-binding protein with PD1-like motif